MAPGVRIAMYTRSDTPQPRQNHPVTVEICPLGTGIAVRQESSSTLILLTPPQARELARALNQGFDQLCRAADQQFETASSLYSRGYPIYEIAARLGLTSAEVETELRQKGYLSAEVSG